MQAKAALRILNLTHLTLSARLVWVYAYAYQKANKAATPVNRISANLGLDENTVVSLCDELEQANFIIAARSHGARPQLQNIWARAPLLKGENALKRPINDFKGQNPVLTLSRAFDASCAGSSAGKQPRHVTDYAVFRGIVKKHPNVDVIKTINAYITWALAKESMMPSPRGYASWLNRKYPRN